MLKCNLTIYKNLEFTDIEIIIKNQFTPKQLKFENCFYHEIVAFNFLQSNSLEKS